MSDPVRTAPMIIDTDVGGDPDDALALVAAARLVPELALVVTADETGPSFGAAQRSRFARLLLDRCGRPDVTVVAGASTADTRYFCVEDLLPDTVPTQPGDVLTAVAEVCAATAGPVRWVGLGPMSNLAAVLRQAPRLAGRLRITQMGGALAYRDPSRAEHNVRLDVPAALTVLRAGAAWVTSDVTFNPQVEIGAGSPLHRTLAAADAGWARLLAAHLDRWFARADPANRP